MTLDDLKNKLAQLDEVSLLETLELTSFDIVNRCVDLIENNFDALELLFDEDTPWDND